MSRSLQRWFVVLAGEPATPPGDAPVFTQHPSSATVLAGQTHTFTINYTGTEPVTITWLRNDVPVQIGGLTHTTPPVTGADDGAVYKVNLENAFGQESSNPATLTVAYPVTITADPQDVTITEGTGNAVFTHTSTGSPPLTYQWQHRPRQ